MRWDKGDNEHEYTFFCGNWNAYHCLGTGFFFICKGIRLAVKR
jgi:hypothetical protein